MLSSSYYRPIKLACAALLLLATACPSSSPTTIATTRMRHGNMALHGVSRLGVAQIGGEFGASISYHLMEELLEAGELAIVDYATEGCQSHARHDLVGLECGVGDANIDALLQGQITAHDHSSQITWRLRSDDDQDEPQVIYTRLITTRLQGIFRLTDSETGRVLGVRELAVEATGPEEEVRLAAGDARHTQNLEDLFDAPRLGPIYQDAVNKMAHALFLDVGFTRQPIVVTLHHDKSPEGIDTSIRALQAAETGDWALARNLYAEAIKQWGNDSRMPKPIRADAYYNYAVALACGGDLPAGIRAMEHSVKLHSTRLSRAELLRLRDFERDDVKKSQDNL